MSIIAEKAVLLTFSVVFVILYACLAIRVVRITRAARHYRVDRKDLKLFLGTISKTKKSLRMAKHKYIFFGGIDRKMIIAAGQSLNGLKEVAPSFHPSSLPLWFVANAIFNAQKIGNTLGESWAGDEGILDDLRESLEGVHNSVIETNGMQLFRSLSIFLFVTFAGTTERSDRSARNVLVTELKIHTKAVRDYLGESDFDACDRDLWSFFYKWHDDRRDAIAYAVLMLLDLQYITIQSWRRKGKRCKEQYEKGIKKLLNAFECVATNLTQGAVTDLPAVLDCLIGSYSEVNEIQRELTAIPDMFFTFDEVA